MKIQLLYYLLNFFCNCWLAFTITQPADRQGLVLFITLWLLFTALTRSSSALLPVVQSLLSLARKNWLPVIQFKQIRSGSMLPLYNLLCTVLGLMLWTMIHPGSIWQACLYITSWLLLALGLLPWFTTAIDTTPQTQHNDE